MLGLVDEKKTAKSLIIEILGSSWPFSAKKLYHVLKKEHRVSFTYQAVYFALQELVKQGIVVSQKRLYMLSPAWVERLSGFSSSLGEKYRKQGIILQPKPLEEMSFDSLAEAFNFCLSNLETDYFGKSRLFYAQVKKLLPFPLSGSQMAALKKFCSVSDAVILCHGNSLLDKATARFLRKIGAGVHLGVCCAQPANTLVINDSVISMYVLYSKSQRLMFDRRVEKLRMSASEVAGRDVLGRCFAFVTAHLKVKLVIQKDPAVRENVLWATQKLVRAVRKR